MKRFAIRVFIATFTCSGTRCPFYCVTFASFNQVKLYFRSPSISFSFKKLWQFLPQLLYLFSAQGCYFLFCSLTTLAFFCHTEVRLIQPITSYQEPVLVSRYEYSCVLYVLRSYLNVIRGKSQ